MRPVHRVLSRLTTCGLTALTAGCHDTSAPLLPPLPYSVITELLSPPSGRDIGDAYAVRDDSVLIGTSFTLSGDSARRGVWWTPGQAPRLMVAPASSDLTSNNWATGLNRADVVVGYISTYAGNGPTLPVRWNPNGTVDTLPTLDPRGGWAYAVNDLGEIVGCSYFPNGQFTAVMWSPTSVIQRFDSTAAASCAYGISSNGLYVVGIIGVHGFRWTASEGLRDLGTLGGTYSLAWAVNRFGEVVGESSDTTGAVHAFTWFDPGVMRALPLLPSGRNSAAYAINDSNKVVGYSENFYGERATLWDKGYVVDLATTGAPNDQAQGLYSHARAISLSGVIAGFQTNTPGSSCTGRICAALWRVSFR